MAIAHERACEAELAGLLEALSMDTQFYELMRRITAAEAGTVVPKKLQVVTVARGDTVASLARRMAYPAAQEERFRVLNALGSRDQLVPGQLVKIVVRAR